MKKDLVMGNTFKNMRKTFQNIAIDHLKRKKQQSKSNPLIGQIGNFRAKPFIIVLVLCGAVFSGYSLVCPEKGTFAKTNNNIAEIEKTDALFISTSEYLTGIVNTINKSGFASIQKEWQKSTPPEIREDAEVFMNNIMLDKLSCKNLSQDKTNEIFTMFCTAEKDSFKIKFKRNQDNSFNLVAIE